MENDKLKLLKELETMGYCITARKIRSDKGKVRGPNSHPRSDKGQPRVTTNGRQQTSIDVYSRLKARLLNMEPDPSDPSASIVEQDINHYFIVIKRKNKVVNKYNEVIHRGSALHRTVKHIQGYDTDLESYRWQAMQDLASNEPFTGKQLRVFAQEIAITNTATMFDLFCQWYHLAEEDAIRWTYKQWKSDYEIVYNPDNTIEQDFGKSFLFNYKYRPGTPEFMPNLSDAVEAVRLVKIDEIKHSKEYINYAARVYAKLEAGYYSQIKSEVLNDSANATLSMCQLDKLVRSRIPTDELNASLNEELERWVNNKLKEYE